MLHPLANLALSQTHRAAIVIPTLLRPALARAVESVFRQEIDGTLQILIGVDAVDGERTILDRLAKSCPSHVRIDVLEPGYSTAFKRGGLYPSRAGGALRTILSYLANSIYVAYLDDDNWWAPAHLSNLLTAIQGAEWAFSQRWFVEAETAEPICVDRWESVGVGAGVYAPTLGGFVDTSSLMLNKLACHDVLPHWSRAAFPDGSGEDRLVFDALKLRTGHETGQATSFYLAKPDDAMAANRLQYFREAGIVLPSQRHAQMTTLSAAAAFLGQKTANDSDPARADDEAEEIDPLLTALVAQLKPQEIIALASGQSPLLHELTRACRLAALAPVFAVFEPAEDLAQLAGQALAVDLVVIALMPVSSLETLLPQAWAFLRAGGIVLGDGEVAPSTPLGIFLTGFASGYRADLLPANLPGRPRWVLQKG